MIFIKKVIIGIILVQGSWALFCSPTSFAQDHSYFEPINTREYADDLYDKSLYKKAVKVYKKIIRNANNEEDSLQFPYLYLRVANSEAKLNNPLKAAEWFDKYQIDFGKLSAENQLKFAQVLASSGQQKRAKKEFSNYQKQIGKGSLADDQIEFLTLLEEGKVEDSGFSLELLDINSDEMDFSPTLYKDGLVFVSNRPGNRTDFAKPKFNYDGSLFLDLYYSKRVSQTQFEPAQPFHRIINTTFHEGPSTFFNNDQEMYFTSNYLDKKGRPVAQGDATVHLAIYYSRYDSVKETWSFPESFPFNSTDYSVGHPTITQDGLTMYFSSNMPGGYGLTDIYVTKRKTVASPWEKPVNLGEKVNTMGDEMFPFIRSNGGLFFSSNGHGGLGGLDIFRFDLQHPKREVLNIGYPMNSFNDDFGLAIFENEFEGYFTSNRESERGKDNIFHFYGNFTTDIPITASVQHLVDSQYINNAKLEVYTVEGERISDATTMENGFVEFALPYGNNYTIIAHKPNFTRDTAFLSLTDPELLDVEDTVQLFIRNRELLVSGKVYDSQTGEDLEFSRVQIINEKDGSTLKFYTSDDGKYEFIADINATYSVLADNPKYFAQRFLLEPQNYKSQVVHDLPLDPIVIGQSIRLDNINYDYNSFTIREDAEQPLRNLLQIMLDNPFIVIELSSHTDSRGRRSYNEWLSGKRAEAAVNWLAERGIKKYRMRPKGSGEEKLVNQCKDGVKCSEEEHAVNRRTEFAVTDFLDPISAYGKDLDFLASLDPNNVSEELKIALERNNIKLPSREDRNKISITGTVKGRSGGALQEGVIVSLRTVDGSLLDQQKTDYDGIYGFRVTKGLPYNLSFQKAGYLTNQLKLSKKETIGSLDRPVSLIVGETHPINLIVTQPNGAPLIASIEILHLYTSEEFVVHTDSSGRYQLYGNSGQEYEVFIRVPGYEPVDSTFTLQPSLEDLRFTLNPAGTTDLLPIPGLHFEPNQFDVGDEQALALNRFIKLVEQEKAEKITIEIHSNPKGNALYLLNLTDKRAESIKEYLVGYLELDESMLTINSFGGSKPLNECSTDADCTDEEFQRNERIIFKLE